MATSTVVTCNWCHKVACESCQSCHNCKTSSYIPTNAKISYMDPITQKGKGTLMLGQSLGGCVNIFAFLRKPVKDAVCFQAINNAAYQALGNGTLFARPCPSRPRHGYIESRVVKTLDALNALILEVIADDPNGEVMLMPYQKSFANAIWTPSLLTVGPDHDGATGGKNTTSIPLLPSKWAETITPSLLHASKIAPTEWPYIEAVTALNKDGNTRATQLRAGPQGDDIGGGDFIPSPMKVVSLLKPADYGDDLLKWETAIKSAPKGTAIWHPGGSPIDHFSIHARSMGIPVIYSTEPKVGDELIPINKTPMMDPQAVLKGLVIGEKIPLSVGDQAASAAALLLVCLHNSSRFDGDQGKWLGIGASLLIRLGATALAGEARHFGPFCAKKGMRDRSLVYKERMGFTLSQHRSRLVRLVNLFRYGAWGGSVGGPKWAHCGVSVVDFVNATREFVLQPNDDTLGGLIRAYNVAVNQAHNGGWWFNKFISTDAFTEIPDNNPHWVLQATRSIELARKIETAMKAKQLEAAIEKLKLLPFTELKPVPLKSVELLAVPGVQAMGFTLTAKGVIGKSRPIYLSTKKVAELLEWSGDTYLVERGEGFALEMRDGSKPPLQLWEEPSLHGAMLNKNSKNI